ncbi:hypothetical protein EK21DRAFT_109685 [Setomelanomma holmii]|uniref:Myb-like DNA-binding domain-containing protein n=1 Tax=Setomelanomma holmii TaxID=210430 RepID=A0A9P4LP12_9PLEO|nr:hypothetical protein EK21DRAFT_109685 [Setomelanomma holmii]
MPTDEENVQYLYLMLAHAGPPIIDWDAVGAAMDLKKGAVTKRWSRLKQSMEKGEQPGGPVYQFLWLCLKHSTRDKRLTVERAVDWQEIADACGTTSRAASKRYSRMKQAFETGEAAPGSNSASPAPKTPGSTSRKKKSPAADDDGEVTPTPTPTPTPKRKRATPKKKTVEENKINIKQDPEVEDEDEAMENHSPKRGKVTKPKVNPKPKVNGKAMAKKEASAATTDTEATTIVKEEVQDEESQHFVDAKEWLNDLVGDQESPDGPCSATTTDCSKCQCLAREVTNVLMSRCQRLARPERLELEQLVGVVDLTDTI